MQTVNSKRRAFLGLISASLATALLLPLRAVAAIWNKAAFEAIKLEEATKNLAINDEIPSKDITIIAPERAENGAIVQVEVISNIPNTEAIAVFVEKNPTALIGNFMFSQYQENNLGAMPQIVTRIKMAETSDIKVIVKAGDQYYTVSKNVIVLENGCGGGGANEKFETSMKLRAKQKEALAEIKAIIIHPMHTGRGKDDFGNIIPAHFIQLVTATLNDKPVLEMQWGTGIAKNPYLTFHLKGAKVGDKVAVTWHDNLGKTGSGEITVS